MPSSSRLPNAIASPNAQSIAAPESASRRLSMKPFNFGCRWKSAGMVVSPAMTRSASSRLMPVGAAGVGGGAGGASCNS